MNYVLVVAVKKHKKCCGKDNVIAFDAAFYNEEFERIYQKLHAFLFDEFEDPLLDMAERYLESYPEIIDGEDKLIFTELFMNWAMLNIPDSKGRTIFDVFYLEEKNRIKHQAVKQTFSKWKDMNPGVFEAFPGDENIKLTDIVTGNNYHISYNEENHFEVGDLALGILVPYQDSDKFLFSKLQLPGIFKEEIIDIIEQKIPEELLLNDVFPDFLVEILQLGSEPLEWMRYEHELVTGLFIQHAKRKKYDDELINQVIFYWNEYCRMNDPIIGKVEAHAAALDYFSQAVIVEFKNVTQAKIAKEYNVSASTISTHFRRLLEAIDLIMNMQEDLSKTPVSNPEKEIRHLTRLLQDQEFDSEEEMNLFLQNILESGEVVPAEHPRDIAQDLLFDANATQGSKRKELIQKALEIYPDSPDAYSLLAEETSDKVERLNLLKEAIEAGTRDLGKEFIKENTGSFWGLIETRPYMRAKAMYAKELETRMLYEEAIAIYKEILKLNPSDNQGIRYLLLSLYIKSGKYFEASELIERYEEATSTYLFNKALLYYKIKGNTSDVIELLKEATKHNPYVLDYLLGRKRVPSKIYDVIGIGDESEAITYIQENQALWEGAEELLKTFIKIN